MNKYETYRLLGKILALDTLPSHREAVVSELQREDMKWQGFVAVADQNLILQALYPKLNDHKLNDHLPKEVIEHLKYIFELTTSRNQQIIHQSEKLNGILQKENIQAVFMKGVGNILDGLYRYPGERILHDIDILVGDEVFETVADILHANAYQSKQTYEPSKKDRTKHYPILFKVGEPVYVELHRMPVGNRYTRIFNTETAFRDARPASASSGFLVMSDEHKIIHNFIHAQFDHNGRVYARESMRNLYDVFLLSARKDLEPVFRDFGHFRRTSSGYLDIVYDTFGNSPPKRLSPAFFLHTFRTRFILNLRYRFVGIASFFLIRSFLGYVIKPFRAIGDKEMRTDLRNKISNPDWYKKQAGLYRRIFGIGRGKTKP